MKKVVLEKVNKTLTFNDFIEKGVTDKEAIKWLHTIFNDGDLTPSILKQYIIGMLAEDSKPKCWIDWVNKNFPDCTNKYTVHIDDVSEEKIYAWKGNSIFKIHKMEFNNQVRFGGISYSNSYCYSTIQSDSLKEMINYAIKAGADIYEFSSQKEFFEWASMVTRTEEVKR